MQTQVGQTPGINLSWQAAAAFARYALQAGVTDCERRCGWSMKWARCCCCQQAGTSLPLAEGFATYMGTIWLQQCVSENRYLLSESSWQCINTSSCEQSAAHQTTQMQKLQAIKSFFKNLNVLYSFAKYQK